jgi:hypothetical protein
LRGGEVHVHHVTAQLALQGSWSYYHVGLELLESSHVAQRDRLEAREGASGGSHQVLARSPAGDHGDVESYSLRASSYESHLEGEGEGGEEE